MTHIVPQEGQRIITRDKHVVEVVMVNATHTILDIDGRYHQIDTQVLESLMNPAEAVN